MAALIRTLYFLYNHTDNERGAEPHIHLRPREVDNPPDAPSPPSYETITGSTKAGFIALGVCGLLSLLATSALFLFLTYRFLFSSRHYAWPLWRNQYVVLIYNLLLVDMQQATAFMLCLYWAVKERIWYPSAACVLQGWWIQTADPGSGLFVIAIAMHTGAVVLRGRQLPHRTFVACVVGLWVFILVLGFIPVGLYKESTFVISEAGWCWLSPVHEAERLWGHYIWIFLSEFGTIILYSMLTFYLRRRMKQAVIKTQTHNYNRSPRESQALKRLNRVVIYMLIYPLSYVVLSLPLAVGRMSSARHVIPSREYFAVAGSLMALSGAVDTVVYALTRRQLLLHTEGGSSGVLTATGAGQGGRIYAYSQDHMFQTHISAKGRESLEQDGNGSQGQGDRGRDKERGKARWMGCAGRRSLRSGRRTLTDLVRDGREDSMEQIVKSANDRDSNRDRNMEMRDMDSEVLGSVGGVYQETTFEITHEEVDGDYQRAYQYRQ
ncbi:G protein-coupled glucose receptor regulating Gpa2-domain-containing protein [Aspergillus terricola var. indicus]